MNEKGDTQFEKFAEVKKFQIILKNMKKVFLELKKMFLHQPQLMEPVMLNFLCFVEIILGQNTTHAKIDTSLNEEGAAFYKMIKDLEMYPDRIGLYASKIVALIEREPNTWSYFDLQAKKKPPSC